MRVLLFTLLVGTCGLVGCNGGEKSKDAKAATVMDEIIGSFNKGKKEGENRAKVQLTQVRMRQVSTYVSEFKLRYNKLPDTLDNLISCNQLTGSGCTPIINDEKEFNDEWGNRLKYEKIDNRNHKIISLGADGKEGGEGFDADIEFATNW